MLGDLLNETRGFKYQITVKVLLKNTSPMEKLSSLQFILIHGQKQWLITDLNFQKILYMIDAWINEGSGWVVESIESQYINISTYRPLLGSSYMGLPNGLKHQKKD